MSSPVASIALRLNWTRQDLFGDLRVRYGIKLGLAGLLALFCTQLLRLPSDNWAILTVLVLMNAQFAGAFAFKAAMRMAGTIAGAVVGVWLVGDYASTPAVFLPLFFLVMALAGYKFGQVGARQVPYAYFLLGLTTLTIASDGITDPGRAWQIGLDRTEEIFVGIISSLLITSLLWPRYAREEFLDAARVALKTVGQLVSLRSKGYTNSPSTPCKTEQIHHTFGQQLIGLRNLLSAGSRESTFFSARLSNYNAFLVSLTNLFQAGLDVGRHTAEPLVSGDLQYETESLLVAISEEFDILTGSHPPGEKLRSSQMNQAFAVFEEKVNEIRDQGELAAIPLETLTAFAGLRSLRDELNNIRSAMEGLPRFGQPLPEVKPHWNLLPTIDWFWVKIGIKGGLAAVISIVFLKWIHPPGAGNVPTWAWLFVVLSRLFLRLGGTGDLRAFQTTVRGCLILAACAILLILTTPFLANYAVMNLVLFLVLFAAGFLTVRISGVNLWMEFAFLTTSAFVALNPQEPVPSQTIIDTFIGMMFGMLIAAVVGRLLWPVLPQRILRDNLLALFTDVKALLGGDPHQERIRTQLAILSVDALGALRQIGLTGCSQAEKLKVTALVRALQVLVARVTQLVQRSPALRSGQISSNSEAGTCRAVLSSIALAKEEACEGGTCRAVACEGRTCRAVACEGGTCRAVACEGGLAVSEITAEILRSHFKRLEIEFNQMLDAFAERFRQGDCGRELPTVRGALVDLDRAVQQLRDRKLLEDLPSEAFLRFLDLVDRYHATADSLDECGRLMCSLQIQRYWGDYGL